MPLSLINLYDDNCKGNTEKEQILETTSSICNKRIEETK